MSEPTIFGMMAEFDSATELTEAAASAYQDGYRRMDGYSPFPIHELPEALGLRKSRLALAVFLGGLAGCVGGFLFQLWVAKIAYPMNVAGRPYNSWPSFIPVTFELTVLFASLTAVLTMLGRNGFPRPHHPVFNVQSFSRASEDGFFLVIEAEDPRFDLEKTRAFLQSLKAKEVVEVPL
jgi:hypothetical protein